MKSQRSEEATLLAGYASNSLLEMPAANANTRTAIGIQPTGVANRRQSRGKRCRAKGTASRSSTQAPSAVPVLQYHHHCSTSRLVGLRSRSVSHATGATVEFHFGCRGQELSERRRGRREDRRSQEGRSLRHCRLAGSYGMEAARGQRDGVNRRVVVGARFPAHGDGYRTLTLLERHQPAVEPRESSAVA